MYYGFKIKYSNPEMFEDLHILHTAFESKNRWKYTPLPNVNEYFSSLK